LSNPSEESKKQIIEWAAKIREKTINQIFKGLLRAGIIPFSKDGIWITIPLTVIKILYDYTEDINISGITLTQTVIMHSLVNYEEKKEVYTEEYTLSVSSCLSIFRSFLSPEYTYTKQDLVNLILRTLIETNTYKLFEDTYTLTATDAYTFEGGTYTLTETDTYTCEGDLV
jgi:hypothetical protein